MRKIEKMLKTTANPLFISLSKMQEQVQKIQVQQMQKQVQMHSQTRYLSDVQKCRRIFLHLHLLHFWNPLFIRLEQMQQVQIFPYINIGLSWD